MLTLEPLGDRAYLARFTTEREAGAWASTILAKAWPGIVDVVAAYRTAAVFADPDFVDLDELDGRLRALAVEAGAATRGRQFNLPVLYDGEDLPEVSDRLGLSVVEVIARHSGQDYQVFAVGFLPGFPYAGYLPDALSGLPRRETPRIRVPAGSVAIAGRQTGVYPGESPGGWQLLGRTPLRIADPARGHFPIRAGDRLRFLPIDERTFVDRRGDWL